MDTHLKNKGGFVLLASPLYIDKVLNIYKFYNIVMAATKRIPVSELVWKELSELKKPGQTFDQLLSEIVEREKKYRLIQDMKKIEEEEEFVELKF